VITATPEHFEFMQWLLVDDYWR